MIAADLLQAVLDAPDDDGPRMVVADALQAAGDPRGEFIAIQCALAGISLKEDKARSARKAGARRPCVHGSGPPSCPCV